MTGLLTAAFVNYKKYPKVELSYCWLHFRQELKEIDCVSETIGWEPTDVQFDNFKSGGK